MIEGKRSFLRAAWQLAAPYWRSEEKGRAWGLLLACLALNLGNVYIDVRINQWNNTFYNALQDFDGGEVFRQLGIFGLLAGISIVLSVYALYLSQILLIGWRRWLTRRYLAAWLADRAYFHLQLSNAGTDNPDQRIADDLNLFTTDTINLSLGLLSAVVSVISFLFILWGLSGPAEIPLGSWGTVSIPAYLVWAALLYAGVGTYITVRIGRPLVPLNFAQQRYEADFRFSLVRLRENAESVAFYGGEPQELGIFHQRFRQVFDNFWRITVRRKYLRWFTAGYDQIAVIFPVIVALPRYLAQEIKLGGLIQIVDAFQSVHDSLSFLITSYREIAEWQAVTERLAGFDERMHAIAAAVRAPQQIEIRPGGAGLAVTELALDLPNGTPLLRDIAFTVPAGESLLINGPTGVGKSTLLRAIAGLWPFGRGSIRIGAGRALFLPQRPYMPLGSLREALLYPRAGEAVPAERLTEVLEKVGLGSFADRLDTSDNWAQRLSLGEQQRLAFGRILLSEPAIVFLDEATSALDEPGEGALYRLLREAPWHPTVISVGHRSTLRDHHAQVLELGSTQPPSLAVAAVAS